MPKPTFDEVMDVAVTSAVLKDAKDLWDSLAFRATPVQENVDCDRYQVIFSEYSEMGD